ncbi:MAG: SulP family inorganic anion transporter [Trueperaceae bacterium]
MPRRLPPIADLVAGASVALVLVPQALAYAELAGLPAHHGLYAAALAPLAAALYASSPALQTGPTAMSAVLVFATLAPWVPAGTAAYASAAALLALLVGAVRVSLGLLHAGALAYALSGPVLRGFTWGAGLLIAASQLPGALGTEGVGTRLIGRAAGALLAPSDWHWGALATTLVAVAALRLGRRYAPKVPMVLAVAVLATTVSALAPGALGPTVGAVPSGLPTLDLALPWHLTPDLLLGAFVIALVGFAEPTAIARRYQRSDRRWDPSRELLGQGLANVVVALFRGMPVGASFSRSALHHELGATTRFGAVATGLTVLALMPAAPLLGDLPRAVLAAVVLVAVADLLRWGPVTDLWRLGKLQATTALATAALTLVLEPRIDLAVVIGVALSVALHLAREGRLHLHVVTDGASGRVVVTGSLWFVNAARLQDDVRAAWHRHREVERWVIDLTASGRVDVDAALALGALRAEAGDVGVTLEVHGGDPRTEERLARYAERAVR